MCVHIGAYIVGTCRYDTIIWEYRTILLLDDVHARPVASVIGQLRIGSDFA